MKDIKKIPQYNGKYWCTEDGEFFRLDEKNTRMPEKISTSMGRVRFYFNGVESRPMVHTILQEVWGPDAARAYVEAEKEKSCDCGH